MAGIMAVDISRKTPVEREALAQGTIILQTATIQRIKEKTVDKGDVIELSRAAAVHGVKQTPLMLLLCHPIPIHSVKVDFEDRKSTRLNSSHGYISYAAFCLKK